MGGREGRADAAAPRRRRRDAARRPLGSWRASRRRRAPARARAGETIMSVNGSPLAAVPMSTAKLAATICAQSTSESGCRRRWKAP